MAQDHTPQHPWSRQTVLYHIYPRSFQDSDGDGIGDLRGIIDRLDYLNDGSEESLGIDAIWLSPVYPSPMADFGYDVADYQDIDPVFGDMAVFDRLLSEAHTRGIKVMLDYVPNHTSLEHPWFQQSRSSRDNPKRDWYIWQPPRSDGSPPNNWLSIFGGPAWTWDETTGEYYLHTFLSQQPDLNWRHPEVRKHMWDVLRFWLDRGVDGFRTDAVYHLIKDDQFRDDPSNPDYDPERDDPYDSLLHTYSRGQEGVSDVLSGICAVVGEYENTYLISEAYVDIPQMLELYHACSEHHIHAPFNFNLIGREWSAAAYRDFIDHFDASLHDEGWPNYVLGNHDRPRLASRLGEERAKLLGMMQLTLRGMPVIYYGEEIGMQNGDIPREHQLDPRGHHRPGAGRDPERTPMQWDDTAHAGFTTGTPWLPVGDNYRERNVSVEHTDPGSCLDMYRRLIHYRRDSPALLTGRYQSLDCENDAIFTYQRICDNEVLQVALNFSDQPQTLSVDRATLVCSTHAEPHAPLEGSVSLQPYEGQVLQTYAKEDG